MEIPTTLLSPYPSGITLSPGNFGILGPPSPFSFVISKIHIYRLADVYPNSTLINGLGRRPGATEVGTPKGLAVVTVAFGKR